VREIERRLPFDRIEEQVRVGYLDAGQVIEVGRLAETRVADRGRRALDDRDRFRSDRVVDRGAPLRELLGRKVGGEERESDLREHGSRDRAEKHRDKKNRCPHVSSSGFRRSVGQSMWQVET
jgi:hypothetical protein